MFRPILWRRLAIAEPYLLFVVVLVFSILSPRTASAHVANATGLIVEQTWTRDGNGHDKTSFLRGDAIQYTVLVTNQSNTTVTATFVFDARGPSQIFFWKQNEPVAPGLSGYYSPSTVPNDAKPGTYIIRVTVTYNGLSSSNMSPFTVKLH